MKYKHKLERLRDRQANWSKMSPKDQAAYTKPGSQKHHGY